MWTEADFPWIRREQIRQVPTLKPFIFLSLKYPMLQAAQHVMSDPVLQRF